MDREELSRWVHEALAHLHNAAYLESHPLAAFLGGGDRPLTGDAMRRVLIDAIEQIKPAQATSATLSAWRRYQHLVLRYIDGYGVDRITSELVVSSRQASRDHRQAIDELAALLWVRYAGQHPAIEAAPPPAAEATRHLSSALASTDSTAAGEPPVLARNLRDTVHGVITTLHKLLPDQKVRIEVSISDTLPPLAIDLAILRQAFLHLLCYAAQVAPNGKLVVTGADAPHGVTVRLSMPDRGRPRTGPIPEHQLREIQELLAAGKSMLVAQGAAVELEGDVDYPSGLVVVVPPVRQATVLVVDDNPDVAGLFRRYLRMKPYRLVQATSGASAIRLAKTLRPDLIILDVLLPSHDGWDVLHALRDTPESAETPVVICSVLPEHALARSLGVADFLAKPVTRAALLATLERWCPVPAARLTPI